MSIHRKDIQGLLLAISVLWMLALTLSLLQPIAKPPLGIGGNDTTPSLGREVLFSSLHLLTFILTTVLWCWAVDHGGRQGRVLGIILCALLGYGIWIEWMQASIPNRSAQWWDMLANSIGIALGFGLYLKTIPHILRRLLARDMR